MKTTLDLPDQLMREIKVRAAREDRKLKDLVAELLRCGLAADEPRTRVRNRMKFPLVIVPHAASPGEELTPERVHEILVQQEIDALVQ
jgi:plasmid stability protein